MAQTTGFAEPVDTRRLETQRCDATTDVRARVESIARDGKLVYSRGMMRRPRSQ